MFSEPNNLISNPWNQWTDFLLLSTKERMILLSHSNVGENHTMKKEKYLMRDSPQVIRENTISMMYLETISIIIFYAQSKIKKM